MISISFCGSSSFISIKGISLLSSGVSVSSVNILWTGVRAVVVGSLSIFSSRSNGLGFSLTSSSGSVFNGTLFSIVVSLSIDSVFNFPASRNRSGLTLMLRNEDVFTLSGLSWNRTENRNYY